VPPPSDPGGCWRVEDQVVPYIHQSEPSMRVGSDHVRKYFRYFYPRMFLYTERGKSRDGSMIDLFPRIPDIFAEERSDEFVNKARFIAGSHDHGCVEPQ